MNEVPAVHVGHIFKTLSGTTVESDVLPAWTKGQINSRRRANPAKRRVKNKVAKASRKANR
jgi:hypothetical protein